MTTRTDCHRPGAIVPGDYAYCLSYRTPGSEPFDHFGMAEVRALCESIDWGRKGAPKAMFGRVGKCGVCGAHYREGDVWRHVPTGDLLHIGHDCARKYELLADREDFCAALESLKVRRAAAIKAELNGKRRTAFLDDHPGLAEALETDHEISRDLKAKFQKYCELSEKQVEFAFRLVAQAKERASRPVEVNVPAPSGKVTVRGIVVSKKSVEGPYGLSLKMTVKVTTQDGVWLCWGTCPESLSLETGTQYHNADGSVFQSEDFKPRANVGDEVEFTATLTPGRDSHFAIFKRPVKARVVTQAAKNVMQPVAPAAPAADPFAAFELA